MDVWVFYNSYVHHLEQQFRVILLTGVCRCIVMLGNYYMFNTRVFYRNDLGLISP